MEEKMPKELKYKGVWNKVLNEGENIKHEFAIGGRYCLFWLVVSIIVGILIGTRSIWIAPLVILVGIVYFGWYIKKAHNYAFTNKRILVHEGFPSTELISVDYNKITDVSVEEPILDKIFTKTGHLSINTAGSPHPEIKLRHIENPYELKKRLDSIRGDSE